MRQTNINAEDVLDVESIDRLIQRALAGEHSQKTLLKNKLERRAALMIYASVKKVVKYFKALTKAAEETAVKSRQLQDPVAFDLVQTIYQASASAKFYQEELDIVEDAVAEYNAYVLDKHIVPQIFYSLDRPPEELVDWRQRT